MFYTRDQQKELAEKSKKTLDKSNKFDKRIVTLILPATPFYMAEDDHQDFYKKKAKVYKKDR